MKKFKRLKIVILILAVLLVVSAGGLVGRYLYLSYFAPAQATATVPDNLFQTGKIEVNLNDGKSVIEEHELLFEPGVTGEKTFFIEADLLPDCTIGEKKPASDVIDSRDKPASDENTSEQQSDAPDTSEPTEMTSSNISNSIISDSMLDSSRPS